MLVAYEDKRFFDHAGVDLLALARAAKQFASNGRIVSGGSTLSMQLARLIEPRESRSFGQKLRQIFRAVQIERRLSKPEILERYLTLAPYGGNLEGVRAASLAWFGKEPKRLSVSEAALLVALPQLPERRRPDRNPAVRRPHATACFPAWSAPDFWAKWRPDAPRWRRCRHPAAPCPRSPPTRRM